MSRSGRTSRPGTSRPRGVPRLPTPSLRRPTVGGGDTSAPQVDLDEELYNVLQKKYDEGELGEKEAIDDAKAVLKEVAQEPIARAMDRAIPRFLTPEREEQFTLKPKSAVGKRSKTPRHAMLTARPTGRGKVRQIQSTEPTQSVPNIANTNATADSVEAMRGTASDPTILSSARQWSSTTSSSYVTEKTSRTNLMITGMEETEELPRTTTAMSTCTDVSVDFARSGSSRGQETIDEELPFTENLLEMPTDTDDIEDVWKSDLVELTKMRSSAPNKGKTALGTEKLELKYKEPQWPHQLLLNQILVKLPRLTHLILDGSELRYLRDLGSSLMSLITLSICDCGLRSLDGLFAIPNLRTLVARKNKITIPTQCSFLNNLSYLDLSSNPITTFEEFIHLRQCTELRILKLHDTPIASEQKFSKRMKKLVPQLKEVHPPYFDASQLIYQIPEDEVKDAGTKKDKDAMMPSLSFDNVMRDEHKTGLAYQQLPNPKSKWQQQQRVETAGPNMGIFMGPNFIKHIEETIPPTTAETEDDRMSSNAPQPPQMVNEKRVVTEEDARFMNEIEGILMKKV